MSSRLIVNSIRHTGASGDAVTLANDGTCTANITNNLSNKNLIINGAMQVSQRGTSSTSTGYQTVDRFKLRTSNTDNWAFTQTHEDVAVSEAPFNTDGHRKYYDIQTTTTETSLAADEYVDILQRIEANNTSHLGYGQTGGTAKTLVLSFWVRAYQTGTYAFYIYLSGGKMQSKNYTISASNTWEKKSFIIEPDGAAQQLPSASYSLQCGWMLAAGSNYTSGSPTTQYTTYADANLAVGQTGNITSSTDNFFHLTGVQLEVDNGSGKPTNFERKSYSQELSLCERYFQIHVPLGSTGGAYFASGYNFNSSTAFGVVYHRTRLRSAPTLKQTTGTDYYTFYRNNSGDYFDAFESYQWANGIIGNFRVTSGISGTGGHGGAFYTSNASSYIAFDSEL